MTIVLEPSNNAGGVRDKVAQAAPVEHNQPLLPRPGVAQAPSPSSTASAAALARLLLAGGRAADALACVEAALSAAPRSTELLHLRGGCLLAAGNVPGAYASLMAALAGEPSHVPALLDLAALYSARGLLAEARDALEHAAAASPGDARVAEALATVLTDLGTATKCAGRLDQAVELYSAAAAAWPALAAAHYNLGVVASEAGRARWPEALEHYARAVAANPGYAQAHCNAGVIHREEGRLEEAVAAYEKALAAAPSHEVVRTGLAAALTDLGTATKALGDTARGIALYERALAVAPRHADAAYNLAVALAEPGPAHAPDRALFLYHTAAGLRPDCAEAWNNAGVLHRERGELERAAECYLAALNIRPNFPQALNNLGVLYTSQGRAGEAIALLQAAVTAAPLYAEAWNNLGVAQRDIGDVAGSIASYERAAALAPEQPNAAQNRLLALNYARPGEDPWVCAEHAAWGRGFAARFQRLPPVSAGDRALQPRGAVGGAPRRLRVGYVSPDLFTHSVSYFAEAPLSHHDAAAVEVYVYDCTPRRDAKSARLQQQAEAAGATWRCVESLGDDALAAVVRSDAIDVLVELTGHTAHNRLGVMARRPAPVQVTWIGYPNSTGLAEVDYRLSDATCDALDTAQTFVEALVRLPGCFLCYTPPRDAPPVAPPPAAGRGFVTFGSFNALAKVTDEVLALWARVLAAVPGSRLVLKNQPFACPQARALWMGRLAALGVAAWRVDLLPLAPSNAEHLAQYALLDVALDPTPYAGTTTTAEALFMGVPVITLHGRCHASNVGASLLSAVGLAAEGWVAGDADAYVARAVEAAADIPRLAALRAGMRQRVLGSPLCAARPFVARLEGVYTRLFQNWLDANGGSGGSGGSKPSAAAAAAGTSASSSGGGENNAAECDDGGSSGRSSRAHLSRLGSGGSDSPGDDSSDGGALSTPGEVHQESCVRAAQEQRHDQQQQRNHQQQQQQQEQRQEQERKGWCPEQQQQEQQEAPHGVKRAAADDE
ncbi:UDP-N-acetylglucosamine--peptide N-acetylglucosaminyltransferase-like [Raphidocelis subcapitata]|uniref:protein O-GlcNAc transferase n=1 Tax=Raphidocelis subcapitata TaxID=307507 RepID=A0A2V0PFY7_9CHLO|nr:UDP-N-acetylglucosamine--peptide N-acetylglucosaminyltransferase-like [Raphidocelis subcapitata]|eukprot:GBF98706.1 UDP-N-acetylglucosamine--peptide N-acetylglucosaminyltransferase-like [Raphidocelis subcapitata]